MGHIFDYIRKNKPLLLVIIPGFIFLMLTIMPSGSFFCHQGRCGLFFWGSNTHDGIWHLALAESAFKSWPFSMPIFSGAKLTGYNFLMDLGIYFLALFKIPISFSYFKLIPFFWFFVFLGLLITLGKKIHNDPKFIFWLLFFSFFGSSLTYLFTLYHQKTIWGSSQLLSMQSGQVLTNLPFALSLVFFLLILLILKKRTITLKDNLLLGFFIFINFGLKFYAGAVSTVVVCLFFGFNFLFSKEKRNLKSFLTLIKRMTVYFLFIITAIFIFYNPLASLKSGSIFIFSPFATMHSLIEEPILFYLKDMVNARYFLYASGGLLSPRLIFIELFSSLLFLIFSMGLRIFGFIYLVIKLIKKKITAFDTAVFLTILFCYLFLVLFIQKGEWWNTVQFYYYFLFLMNFFTAGFFYEITKSKNKLFFNLVIFAAVVIVSLPGNIDIFKNFTRFPSFSYIPKEELSALSFIKKQPSGIIFMFFYEPKVGVKTIYPEPLYSGTDTSYLAAYTGKPIFLADSMQLHITGVDYKPRLQRIKDNDCSILKEVYYLYKIKDEKSIFFERCVSQENKNLKIIFENSKVEVYKKI